MSTTLSHIAPGGTSLDAAQALALIAQACPAEDYRDKRILLIVPDATRTCPLGMLFAGLHAQIGGVVNYVNQTFGLFKAAEALRPPKLLTPKAKA